MTIFDEVPRGMPWDDEDPCETFHWVGQAFSSCDRCGEPYWEHTYRQGMGKNWNQKIKIPFEEKQQVFAKWGPKEANIDGD